MSEEIRGVALTETPTNTQRLFVRYQMAALIDLTVLNLFDEYWRYVIVDSFTVSIFAAVLLQVLLKVALALEHRVACYFGAQPGSAAKFLRFFVAWLILFGSKFVMLGAIDFAFGEDIEFNGPLDGLVAFFVVVMVMLAVEEFMVRLYRWLAKGNKAD